MVTSGGGDTTELLATVGFKWLGSGDIGDAPGGNVDPNKVKKNPDELRKETDEIKRSKVMKDALLKRVEQGKNHLRSTFGINIGIASILKQSQIFTGTLGTIFQILGALVDVILAPFLPIIVPALKSMARNIPLIKEKADRIIGAIVSVFNFFKTSRIGEFFSQNKFGKIIRDSFQYFLITLFLTRLVGLHRVLWTAVKFIAAPIIAAIKLLLAPLFRMMGLGIQKVPVDMSNLQANLQTAANTLLLVNLFKLLMNRGGSGPIALGPGQGAARGLGRFAGPGAVGLMGVGTGVGIGAATAGAKGAGFALGGAVVGGAIGMLAGPMGAAIGASIGSMAGGIIAAFMQKSVDDNDAMKGNPDYYNYRPNTFAAAGVRGDQFSESRRTFQ